MRQNYLILLLIILVLFLLSQVFKLAIEFLLGKNRNYSISNKKI